MDPQSFIISLMAGITLFGGGILLAMIVLERRRQAPRGRPGFVARSSIRLRQWFEQAWLRAKIRPRSLQAEVDHGQSHEPILQELARRRQAEAKRRLSQPPEDRN
jgi:hypothetical protein